MPFGRMRSSEDLARARERRQARRARLRRVLPPLALLAGLFFFGLSLLLLGTGATEEASRELDPASLTLTNGSAVLVYPVDYYGYRADYINVTYSFPTDLGDAYFVGCADTGRLRGGHAPTDPVLAFASLREGTFIISHQTIAGKTILYPIDPETGLRERVCDPAVVFRWDAAADDPSTNRPQVSVVYHSDRLDGEEFGFLAALMGASALVALLGGLAWVRGRTAPTWPASDDSTVEALRTSLDRMGEQLERTRKLLLLAGVLGVFLWYPFLVPWAWLQAARASDDPVIPWAVAALTLLFLVALTVLWAREFLRLDRELDAWRGRIGELRDKEAHLMDTLESEGG